MSSGSMRGSICDVVVDTGGGGDGTANGAVGGDGSVVVDGTVGGGGGGDGTADGAVDGDGTIVVVGG